MIINHVRRSIVFVSFFYVVENISTLAVSLPQIALNLPQFNAQTLIIKFKLAYDPGSNSNFYSGYTNKKRFPKEKAQKSLKRISLN